MTVLLASYITAMAFPTTWIFANLVAFVNPHFIKEQMLLLLKISSRIALCIS